MVRLPESADSPPDCPHCETDLLVCRSTTPYFDWRCEDCRLLWDQEWTGTAWGAARNKRRRQYQ